MYMLLIPVVLYMFRAKIAQFLAPYVGQMDPQRFVFRGHLCSLLFGSLYIIPFEFVGLGGLQRVAYLGCLWAQVATSMWTIKANYGAPPTPQITGGFSMAALKETAQTAAQTMAPWFQKAMNTADFQFLFFVLIFLTAYPSVWALAILLRRSLWTVGKYGEKNLTEYRLWKLFSGTWAKLSDKELEAKVLHYSVLGEILLGFWLIVSLALPSRQILVLLLYWNYLKTRYQTPRSHANHEKAWIELNTQVAPLVEKVSILQKPIDMGKGWFQSGPAMQQ
eukprot:TRINITY_DN2230_c1_g7_i1.p1 TRINITY_DN2230_c1_g7~~TRINITY_DN2230_c1_g7_i1.p1  ORF type:complete len:278 (+),score=36.02 TRINITY_DN2230_c1_g7_i1:101-934(+)